MDAQKFCTNCGTQITGGAQFCSICGTKVEVESNETTDYQESVEVPRSQLNTASPINKGQTYDSITILKEKIIKEFFSYDGRLNRLAYFWRLLIVMTCIGVLCIMTAILEESFRGLHKLLIMCYLTLIPCIVSNVMLGIRRCHDLNKPGWFIGLTYIPVVGVFIALYIMLAPGMAGTNSYGLDPLDDRC